MSLIGRRDVTKNLRESERCVFSFPGSTRTSWKEAKNEAEEPGYHLHCPFPCLQNHSNQVWFVKTTDSRQSTTQGSCLPLSSAYHPPSPTVQALLGLIPWYLKVESAFLLSSRGKSMFLPGFPPCSLESNLESACVELMLMRWLTHSDKSDIFPWRGV